MLRKILLSVFAFALLAAVAWARTTDTGKPTRNVFDGGPLGISAGQAAHWTKDTVYILMEQVYVESTATLTIDPGTVIKGMPIPPALGSTDTSALIICRGAKIFANGTPTEPIVFTTALDLVDDPTDLPLDAQELWGGVLVGGQATIKRGPTDEFQMEGLPPDPRNAYGASAGVSIDADNSGVIRYVSIRHGGVDFSPTNEVNGLTLCGVGSGTTIDHVEVWSNGDDAFEWFGGRVNAKFLIAAYCEDDHFDWDQGYIGKNQFLLSYQVGSPTNSNHTFEMDGPENPTTALPTSEPTYYNVTGIGAGVGAATADNDRWGSFRDNTGCHIKNSIFTDFNEQVGQINNTNTTNTTGGNLEVADNIFWRFGCHGGVPGALADPACYADAGTHLGALFPAYFPAGNLEADPLLTAIARPLAFGAYSFDPLPTSVSPANAGYPDPSLSDPFFTPVTFAGAFDDDSTTALGTWECGWTALQQYGVLKQRRGDLTGDGNFTAADAVTQLNVVFLGNSAHYCRADTNCDGSLTAADAVNELNLVFLGNPLACW